jgi:hypothetical protein
MWKNQSCHYVNSILLLVVEAVLVDVVETLEAEQTLDCQVDNPVSYQVNWDADPDFEL